MCVIIMNMIIESKFVASHAVLLPIGKEEMHKHNWQVVAEFSGVTTQQNQVTEVVMLEANKLSGVVLNDLEQLKQYHASAESVAKYLFDKIAEELTGLDVRIVRLEVEEEPGCRAAYRVE